MSPETPTAAAMEAAQSALPCLCGGVVAPTAGQHTTPYPHSTSCPKAYVYKVAAAIDAYAAEQYEIIGQTVAVRIATADKVCEEMTAERDAALAKLKAAEAEVKRRDSYLVSCPWCHEPTEDRTATNRLAHLIDCGERQIGTREERVRVLEEALLEIRERAGREGRASQVARAALAKAAAEGGKE